MGRRREQLYRPGGAAASSARPSPYLSPNVSLSPHYTDLPPDDPTSAPIVVSKQNVTTVRTSKASHSGGSRRQRSCAPSRTVVRSEGGAECQPTLEANGRMPNFSSGGNGNGGLMPEHRHGGGRVKSYSTPGSLDPPPSPPQLRMPRTGPKMEAPWANLSGAAL
ncbi:Calcineurin responsive transcriptional factor [Mycena venus]|uniref:Calcineurin responsive transcriptional factor n=1 Tax=Mycena venus TaxID=2733690 RepID=A0A8H6XAD0_9AGAR|nr:Calcineurin responsive transcriptional factor [Mycena venus]